MVEPIIDYRNLWTSEQPTRSRCFMVRWFRSRQFKIFLKLLLINFHTILSCKLTEKIVDNLSSIWLCHQHQNRFLQTFLSVSNEMIRLAVKFWENLNLKFRIFSRIFNWSFDFKPAKLWTKHPFMFRIETWFPKSKRISEVKVTIKVFGQIWTQFTVRVDFLSKRQKSRHKSTLSAASNSLTTVYPVLQNSLVFRFF